MRNQSSISDHRAGRITRSATAVRLLAVAASIASCGPPAEEASVDLVEAFPLAEIDAETRLVDFGTDGARRRMKAGWSWNETSSDGMSFVWGVGGESRLELFLAEPRDLRALLRCFPYTFPGASRQSVTVAVNGRQLATLQLRPKIAEYRLGIPAAKLRAGTNQLALRYAYSQTPEAVSSSRDQRRLAVGWDFIRFEGVAEPGEPVARAGQEAEPPGLYLPFGTEVAYYLGIPAPARLTVEDLAVRGGGRLQVLWQVEGAEPRELRLGRRAELPGDGRPARLALRAVGQASSGGWNGVRISAPRVQWRRPRQARPEAQPSRSMRAAAASEALPNVLLYLVDTLRADRLGCYGQSEPLSPNVDELAAEGVVFERALAQTSWTKPAVASILTGLGPLRHGVNQTFDALPDAARTLAERLRDEGYRTAAFVTNAYLTETSGLAQGFDHYDFSEDLARELNARILSWLEVGGQRPFFLYVHTIDPHAPYDPLAPFRERFASAVDDPAVGTIEHIRALGDKRIEATRAVVDTLLLLYNAEVAQNDAAFGALREGLWQRGLDAGTVIVFLSDHGEAFHEHGVFGHGWDLFQQVLEVPFLLRLPNGPKGLRVSEVVQHVDVAPTLLDVLGLPVPGEMTGRSLLPLVRGEGVHRPRPVFSYMNHYEREGLSVVWEDWKLIEPLGSRFAARRQLFRPWRDLLENRDLMPEHPVLSGYLAALGRGELRQLGQGLPAAEDVLDDDTRQMLKALGYLR